MYWYIYIYINIYIYIYIHTYIYIYIYISADSSACQLKKVSRSEGSREAPVNLPAGSGPGRAKSGHSGPDHAKSGTISYALAPRQSIKERSRDPKDRERPRGIYQLWPCQAPPQRPRRSKIRKFTCFGTPPPRRFLRQLRTLRLWNF